jgi:hypothetical protein
MQHLTRKLSPSKVFIFISIMGVLNAKGQAKFVKALIPDQAIIQYAGSIGYLSAGLGYNFFKERSVLSFHYGIVPVNKGGELNIVAVKFDYRPFSIKIGDHLLFHPVNPVIFLSYTLGNDFRFRFNQDQYTKGYYFWSPALREHLGVSSELKLLGDNSSKIKSISIYAEANTNDLYMVSWYANRTSTPIYKIFHTGFGLKINF